MIQPCTPNELVRTFMKGLENRLNTIKLSFATVKVIPSTDIEHLITTYKASNEIIYGGSDLNRIHFKKRLQILRKLRIT